MSRRPKARCLAIALAMLALCAPRALAEPGVVFVDGASALPAHGCGARAHPCPTIQDGVDAAQPGDEIRVAAGVYDAVNHRGGLAQVAYVTKSLVLRGGYLSPDWEHADPAAHPTTLDAQGRGRALYASGDIRLALEGLRITGGDATGLGGGRIGEDVGGGVCAVSVTLTISDSLLHGNTAGSGLESAGGGVYVRGGSVTLADSAVSSNSAGGRGGGLYLRDSAVTLAHSDVLSNTARAAGGGLALYTGVLTATGSILSRNSADYGGGMVLDYTTAQLQGTALTSNAAGRFGGGLYAGGSTVVLASNAISGNRSVDAGGGLYLANSVATLHDNTIASNESSKTGGGGLALRFSEVTLTRNVLSGNVTAGDGGGMSAAFGSAELTGNVVSGNLAYHSGGGLYLGSARALLIGNTVSGNVAHIAGGGLRLAYGEVELRSNLVVDNRAGDAGSGGSGFYIEDCACRLLHTTIARNDGGEGSGIRVAGPSGRVALTNTILVSHTVGITVAAGSAATLEATLWGDGSWANATDWGGEGVVVTGALNIWGPPAFLNGEVGDYHITPDSAARDAGVDAGVTSDIDGHPRPAGLAPDLGADELCYPIFLPLSLRQPLSFALEDGYVATIAPEVTGYQMVVFEGE